MAASLETSHWQGKRVLVTGGTGFIGRQLVRRLMQHGAHLTVLARSLAKAKEVFGDLDVQLVEIDLTLQQPTRDVVEGHDQVFHLAGVLAGVAYQAKHPASLFRDNIRQTMNLLDACVAANISQVTLASSANVYAPQEEFPLHEQSDVLAAPPKAGAGYAWAKRMMEFLADAYHQEFGLTTHVARLFNCYGPHMDLSGDALQVIPALIKRICIQKERPPCVWGSGNQIRSFLYVEDAVSGLLQLATKQPQVKTLNIAGSETVNIRQLVDHICRLGAPNETIEVQFDTCKPEGLRRADADISLAREQIDYQPQFSLEQGLAATIAAL